MKRAGDLTARSLALAELQDALELPAAPLRIECIDISHVQGTNVVASMVVFEDGLAKKPSTAASAMRSGSDDTASSPRWSAAVSPGSSSEEADRRDEQAPAR